MTEPDVETFDDEDVPEPELTTVDEDAPVELVDEPFSEEELPAAQDHLGEEDPHDDEVYEGVEIDDSAEPDNADHEVQ